MGFISNKGNFKNEPILYSFSLINPLCIPITCSVTSLNIGAPDEQKSVLHLCSILYSFIISIPLPFDTFASFPFGKCNINILSFL